MEPKGLVNPHAEAKKAFRRANAGSEKIVFGTDMPWYSPHFAAGSVLFAHITDDDRHNILHRNAAKILEKLIEQ